MPDTQVERISQLDIGDGKLYEFAGANNGMVFNDVTEALAAIQAGTVADGDVFYIKNDGTSGYPVFIGTSAQIAAADNAGKIPAGMIIFCTDDSVNAITALQVGYDNTDSGLEAETVQGAIDEIDEELTRYIDIALTIESGNKDVWYTVPELNTNKIPISTVSIIYNHQYQDAIALINAGNPPTALLNTDTFGRVGIMCPQKVSTNTVIPIRIKY